MNLMSSSVSSRLRRLFAGPFLSRGKNNDGPPDLDELWNDFNDRLGGLFGPKGRKDKEAASAQGQNDPLEAEDRPAGDGYSGGSGHRPPPPRPTRPPLGGGLKGFGMSLGMVIGLAGVVWLATGTYIVQEGHKAVVTSFGKFSHTTEAGIQWRLPYPFQAHETVPFTQLRSVEVGRNAVVASTGLRDSSMLTQDENIVDIRFTVQYRLKDAREYVFENRNTDEAVVQAAESAVREIVGKSQMDSVLYEQRDAIAVELVKSIQAQLDRLHAGILISNVNVQSVQAPEQVQAAFDDAFRAGADRERLKNEGEAYANDVIPKAQGTAARLREEAEAYKARVVAQAEGDAQRFAAVLTEYQKAPGVTRDRMYIDTMQQVFTSVTKVMVDSRSGSNLLYLPLDKLIKQSGSEGDASTPAPSTQAAPTAPAANLPPAPVTDVRSRESSRTRERDPR